MRIELLFIEGCPNLPLARSNLRAALARAGLSHVPVKEHVMSWDADQGPPPMNGSPTILIDGVDPFAADDDDQHPLSCRVYRTPRGVSGAPTPDELYDALQSAEPNSAT